MSLVMAYPKTVLSIQISARVAGQQNYCIGTKIATGL